MDTDSFAAGDFPSTAFSLVRAGSRRGMADVTLKEGIEKTLLAKVPGVTAVRDVTDHASGTNPYFAAQ